MSKTPKLRFKEFSGDWEEKKLGDIFTIYAGGDLNKEIYSKEKTEEHIYPVYSNGLEYNGLYGYYNIYKETKNKITVTARGVNIGSINVRKNNFTAVGRLLVLTPIDSLNYNLDFFKYNMSQNIRLIKEETGVPQLTAPSYAKYSISITSIEEQEKIASFFSLIDDKISLQGEKVEALKDYKSGMMQKIFSRELRFKDDEGRDYPEWEEKKLGECIENKGGTALEKFVDENGTHKFISIGNYSTSGKYIDSGQRISLNDKTKDKLLYKNDLVMVLNDKTSTGDLIGATILIDEDDTYIYNQRSERLICNENINPNFAWILLNYEDFRKRVFSIAQGGTQIYVNFPSVKNLNIQLPSLKEQNKISELILALDNKIEKEQEKLDSLNEYKKGLLQQMFV